MDIYEKLYLLIDNRQVDDVYGILIDYHDYYDLVNICEKKKNFMANTIGSVSIIECNESSNDRSLFDFDENTFMGLKFVIARGIEEPRLII